MIPIRTILHPTDFSPHSAQALELASALAHDYLAQLVILHVAEPVTAAFDGMVAPQPEGYLDDLYRQLTKVRPQSRDITVEHQLVQGNPAAEIARVARDQPCDLVVMGTHGRTGLGRLLMGSVAEQVVRKASCPVLTVKTPMPRSSLTVEPVVEKAGSV
jgi:nucleotide-binding universal stress UspA family protein